MPQSNDPRESLSLPPTVETTNRVFDAAELAAGITSGRQFASTTSTVPSGALRVRCPHCRLPIEIAPDDVTSDITCRGCGSTFNLATDGNADAVATEVRRIGHFDLVERIGAGAFGTVWKALDTELDRTVAIKVPRKDQLEPVEIDKTLREARAAAQLRHPNIVSIYEVGRDGDKIYIVSELIRGTSLVDWLSHHQPTFRESAALCQKIAVALDHAHQQGVIHRDLKPANILIDGEREPHIADFGLAKRDAGEVTMTLDGQVLGTPAYMSPEQARGQAHRADRRSDVYSLGVVLFEMLTGERPFRGDVRMVLHRVVHDEAPSPRQFNAAVPRDLETICLKCLEKDSKRRYPTAATLAAELRHFLAGEPIAARPISRPARLVRWCRRRPLVASLLAAITFCLLAGTVVSTLFAIAANRAADEANKTAERETLAKKDARHAIDKYVQAVTDEDVLKDARFQPLRKRLLDDARRYYARFQQQHSHDEQELADLARAISRLAAINNLSGSKAEALATYQSAVAMYRRLANEHPEALEYHQELAGMYNNVGNLQNAMGERDAAATSYESAFQIQQRLVELNPRGREGLASLAQMHRNFANFQSDKGNVDAAITSVQHALAIQHKLLQSRADVKTECELARSYNTLADLQTEIGQFGAATSSLERAVAIQKTLVEKHPDAAGGKRTPSNSASDAAQRRLNDLASYQFDLAGSYCSLAYLQNTMGKPKDAVAWMEKALPIQQTLVQENPTVTKYLSQLASTHNNLAVFQSDQGELARAIEMQEQALAIRKKILREHPNILDNHIDVAGACVNIGRLTAMQGQYAEALPHYEQAIERLTPIVVREPKRGQARTFLRNAYWNRGATFDAMGRYRDSAEDFLRAAELTPNDQREALMERHRRAQAMAAAPRPPEPDE